MFKIDCDALGEEDWTALAWMAVELLAPFSEVIGIPRGGFPFAHALGPYITQDTGRRLVVDDVLTTGGSMENWQHVGDEDNDRGWEVEDVIGCVVFARGPCPKWITPLLR